MKRILLIAAILCFAEGFCQEDAWVYFTDKPNASAYFANPLLMLSQRSLDRRTAQNIPLDIKDVPLHAPYVVQVKAATGITVKAQSKWLNALHVRGSVSDINALSAFSFVDHLDFANHALNNVAGRQSAAKKIRSQQKQLDVQVTYPYGTSANQVTMLQGDVLHGMDFTGSGKIIAVLDAGFPGVDTAAPFQNLQDNNQVLGGYDFVNHNASFYTGNQHGTMVLSTMGGYVQNELIGTAPDAQYYLFITEDINSENPVEESYWVEGAERADSLGVDVINTSLGYFQYDNPNYSYTYSDMNGQTAFITRGADIAFSRGMIVVCSAGNSGGTANPHIGCPADGFNVLTVGAVTASGEYASFSSTGYSADGRVKPDVMAQGQQTVLSLPNGTVTAANGTSFSSPVTAGLVACLWQALPTLTNAEIVARIKQSADHFTNPDAQFGYGIPDFSIARTLGNYVGEAPRFGVYPNPVRDLLYFSFEDGAQAGHFILYNNLGQTLLEKDHIPSGGNVSLGGLPAGLYFYSLKSGDTVKSGKLIHQ